MTNDIGGQLRRAREERGLSLRDAAARTKHSIAVIQAIERNDFNSLPGGMFRKAYVRTLAAEVGLDPEEIAGQYAAQYEAAVELPSIPSAETVRDDQFLEQLTPSPRRSFLSLMALVVLATAWFMLQRDPARPDMPEDDNGTDFVAVRVPAAAEPVSTERAKTAFADEDRGAPLWIEINAASWCWIAAETDGERALYRLVEPGERVMLEGWRIITLRVGDAGAVALSINDGPKRSLGRNGDVVELEVTADNVEQLRQGDVGTVSGV